MVGSSQYDSKASEIIDMRFIDIRVANKRIMELEKELISKSEIKGIKESLYAMNNALYVWWQNQGFNLVTDENYGFYGFRGRFCLDTSLISFLSTRPVSEKEEKRNRLDEMIEEGYEFIQEGSEYVLLDNPNNRGLITNLVRNKFKSIEIVSWENRKISKKEEFKLRGFEAYIRDLIKIKLLIEEQKEE